MLEKIVSNISRSRPVGRLGGRVVECAATMGTRAFSAKSRASRIPAAAVVPLVVLREYLMQRLFNIFDN
jgi:hypothetical protein